MHAHPTHDDQCGTARTLRACPPLTARLADLAAEAGGRAPAAPLAPGITRGDSLAARGPDAPRYDAVIANPPFSGANKKKSAGEGAKSPGKTELLFTERMTELLNEAGRGCILVPAGLLYGGAPSRVGLRRALVELHGLRGVVSLPTDTFKPHATLACSLLVTRRGAGTADHVWFADATQGGLAQVPERWRTRTGETNDRAAPCFLVPVEELRARDYDLTPGRYRPKPKDDVDLRSPKEILHSIMILQAQANRIIEEMALDFGIDFGIGDLTGDEPDPLAGLDELLPPGGRAPEDDD